VDETLVVASSRISGQGLFASERVESGRLVIRLGGHLVSTSELRDLHRSSEYVDTLTVHEDLHLVLPSGTKVHFGNHSCDPNLWHLGPYEIVARRDIEPGDEVTIDYGTQSGAPGFSMACDCAADLCRGVVTSDDWKLAHLQAIYAGHWVPALEERIRRQT
jgi:SET domain-containing protein